MLLLLHAICPKYEPISEILRKNPNKTCSGKTQTKCSGSVAEVFSWLCTGNGFRQGEICILRGQSGEY